MELTVRCLYTSRCLAATAKECRTFAVYRDDELVTPPIWNTENMMFLFSGIRAEIEPVPNKQGWYQLTGKHIERWTEDISETFYVLKTADVKVDYRAKILGVHDRDPEIELRDPRFNHENDPEGNASFGVYTEGGRTFMLLAVNQAEYAIFRFLCPHQAGDDEEFDPLSDYRVETSVA